MRKLPEATRQNRLIRLTAIERDYAQARRAWITLGELVHRLRDRVWRTRERLGVSKGLGDFERVPKKHH